MSVVECDVPRHSALGKDLIERANFRDAYRAPLSRSDRSVVDEIFFAIFAQRPGWMKLMLIARNKAVALAGLEVPTTSEIMNMEQRDRYFIGEKIGCSSAEAESTKYQSSYPLRPFNHGALESPYVAEHSNPCGAPLAKCLWKVINAASYSDLSVSVKGTCQ